jgi:sulfotransferase
LSRYHFISGLPRSGSTLLAALLSQNPALRSGITSAVGSFVSTMLREVSQSNESAIFLDDAQRAALLRGVFDGYYHALEAGQTAFDVNRGWTTRVEILAELFPDAKIVCCVRPIPWVLDSVERVVRRNKFQLSKIFGFDATGTVYQRVDGLMSPNGLVGYALDALKQAMHSRYADRLLLLPYDTLVSDPAHAMAEIYAFTGVAPFAHDFDNVSFATKEFDARLGTPGLHDVRPKVERQARQSILPPDLFNRFDVAPIWRDPAFNVNNVRIVDRRLEAVAA